MMMSTMSDSQVNSIVLEGKQSFKPILLADYSMTSNMKSKTFWREYDDLNDAVGVKQVIVGAKGDYIILG